MSTNKSNLHKNQAGLVSFMVVTIIMIVLTLIILSFARIVRREQVQTLDRQLNAQAFYAAESGINDTLNALSDDPTLAANSYNDCDDFINSAGLVNDLGNGVSYSCLLVDASVSELIIDNVPSNQSVVLPIQPEGANPVTNLEFTINDSSDGANLGSCPNRGEYTGNWPGGCDIGILRIELVEFNGNKNRNDLLRDRGVIYVQPSNGSGGDPVASWNEFSDRSSLAPGYRTGERHTAVCNAGGAGGQATCNVDLSGLNIQRGYLRLRSIYRNVGVTVRALAGTSPVSLIGAQAEIDVTGRVSGVIKRVKVRAPIPVNTNSTGPLPEFALQSTDSLCKRFQITGPPANVLQFGLFLNSTTGANDDCNPGQTSNN